MENKNNSVYSCSQKSLDNFSSSCVHDNNCNSTSVLAYIVIYPSAYLCATRNILLRISIWITTYVLPRNILHSFFAWTKITFWKEWAPLTYGLNYTQTSFYVVIVRWNNAIRTRTTQDQRIIILGPSTTTRSLPEQLPYVFFQLSDQVGDAVADHSLLPPYLYM